jgi:AcrR family transcriptional regulator
MAIGRRVGSATSEKRALILEATEQVMLDEGYAAVTSRSVADRAGINASLVHYYFPTLDDLIVAVFRRGAERNLERMAAALQSPEPLQALWRFSSDPRGSRLLVELMAAANHRKALHIEVVELAERTRKLQLDALKPLIPDYGIDEEAFPATLIATAIQGIALLLVREQDLGVTTGHDEAAAAMAELVDRLEHGRARGARRRSRFKGTRGD